jgi:hypothetical protein
MNCLLEDAKNSPTALRCGGVEQVPHHHQGQGVFKKKTAHRFSSSHQILVIVGTQGMARHQLRSNKSGYGPIFYSDK